jgi:hypothetical protein
MARAFPSVPDALYDVGEQQKSSKEGPKLGPSMQNPALPQIAREVCWILPE